MPDPAPLTDDAAAALKALLDELAEVLEDRHPQTFHSLQPPASDEALAALEARLGGALAPELRVWFQWRDGQSMEDPIWGSTWQLLGTDEFSEMLSLNLPGLGAARVPLFKDNTGNLGGFIASGKDAGKLFDWDHEDPEADQRFRLPTLHEWARRAIKARKRTRTGFKGPFPSWRFDDIVFNETPELRTPGELEWLKALPPGAAFSALSSRRQTYTSCCLLVKLAKNAWASCTGFGDADEPARTEAFATMRAWLAAEGKAPGVACEKDAAAAQILDGRWVHGVAEVHMGRPPSVPLDLGALSLKRELLPETATLTQVRDPAPLVGGSPWLKSLTIQDSKDLTDAALVGLTIAAGLQSLTLERCAGLTSLEGLTGLDHLVTLTVKDCPALDDEGWRAVAQLPALKRFWIERSRLTETGLRHLIWSDSLRHVRVHDCEAAFSTELWEAGGWTFRWD